MPKKYGNVYYNRTNTCDNLNNLKEDGKKCECRLTPGNALREYENEKWTGRWLCRSCWEKNDYNKRIDSHVNIIKSLSDRRTNNLDQESPQAKGDISEAVTCMTRGVKNLNIENDNFTSPIDHSRDAEYGIIQSKGAIYNTLNRDWRIRVENERKKEFDNLIVYCMNKDMNNIERVYIFPKKEVIKRSSIRIYKTSYRSWYGKYRVDEKPYNDTLRKLLKK